jgi:beta propeller repeat protein
VKDESRQGLLVMSALVVLLIVSIEEPGEFLITTNSYDQCHPAIYENVILWAEIRDFSNSYDIYGYDISKELELQLAIIPDSQ